MGLPNNTFPGKAWLFKAVEETAAGEAVTETAVVGAAVVGLAVAAVVSFAVEVSLFLSALLLPWVRGVSCTGCTLCVGCVSRAGCVPGAEGTDIEGAAEVEGTAEVDAGSAVDVEAGERGVIAEVVEIPVHPVSIAVITRFPTSAENSFLNLISLFLFTHYYASAMISIENRLYHTNVKNLLINCASE